MPAINRVDPYTVLSEVYQSAGFADYSAHLAPRLLDLAFELEWTGRSLLDLACGTGDLVMWFAEHNFRAAGVDSSPEMTRPGVQRAEARGFSVDFITGDMRTFEAPNKFEMVTCLGGSLNIMLTLRDLDQVFRQARAALMSGKLFCFDLYTIQGLARYHDTDRVMFDANNIYIVARDSFSFESLLLTRRFTIMRCNDGANWVRAEELHPLRGYPVQAVLSSLGKAGFKVIRTLTPAFESAEQLHNADQLLFVAQGV